MLCSKSSARTPDEAPSATILIFGASGDLVRRKLVPALLRLYSARKISPNTRVIGVGRTPHTDRTFRDRLEGGVDEAQALSADGRLLAAAWAAHAASFSYVAMDPTDRAALTSLADRVRVPAARRSGQDNVLIYLATPPDLVSGIVRASSRSGLLTPGGGWTRVVFEKPFGRDLESARSLDRLAHDLLAEDQIYRIDHYLGKETVQNLLTLRFANAVLEPLWNRHHVDHVQISVLEDLPVGRRGSSYDRLGVIRDVVQNHVLQLLALIAMEPPTSLAPNDLRDSKAATLTAVRPLGFADLIVGQYEGYEQEDGVDPASRTPTYAAGRLFVDNDRWAGTPFFFRTGKGMAVKTTEITLQFRSSPHVPLFEAGGSPNRLSLRLQPDEGLQLRIAVKRIGAGLSTQPADLRFDFGSALAAPDAYERLLLDALLGDPSLFLRDDEIEASWRVVAGVLAGGPPPLRYARNSMGPEAAMALLNASQRDWLIACRCAAEPDA